MNTKHQEIQDYYGKALTGTADLKTSACCTISQPPKKIQEALKLVHDEVKNKYYGCGLTIPTAVEGLRILDLGSGSGRDCFLASLLVGEQGSVVGVDMTAEQLAVANKYVDYHAEAFGFKTSNVRFVQGNIEALDQLGLEPVSFDLIISNCVINLATDKEKVLRDAWHLLKTGGEMYFSDMYCDRRVPAELQEDPVLWGECLSGALYWNDFLQIARKAGFTDPRSVACQPVSLGNEALESQIGHIKFFSVTYRLFKIDGLESDCEDYGQAVKYQGTIADQHNSFELDDHHNFPKGKMMPVCGNTFKMLHDTRFARHFEFYGSFDTHYGIYEGCGTAIPFKAAGESGQTACC